MVEENLDLPSRLARRFRGRMVRDRADWSRSSPVARFPVDELESAAAAGLVAAAAAFRGPIEGFRRYAAAYCWGELRAEVGWIRSLDTEYEGADLDEEVSPERGEPRWEDPRLPALREALKSIPTGHREVVRSLMRGDTRERIARRLGVSRTTVERWRDEAIGRLRERIAELVA